MVISPKVNVIAQLEFEICMIPLLSTLTSAPLTTLGDFYGSKLQISYLPNPSARAGYDTRSIFFKAELNRFEFRVFLLLD